MTGRNGHDQVNRLPVVRWVAVFSLALLSLGRASPAPAAGNPYAMSHALRVALPSLPVTADPHMASWNDEISSARQVFDTLTTLDEAGVVHGVLASGWTFSQDFTVYTFTLRLGAVFSSGRLADAQAVRSSFLRSLQKNGDYVNTLFDIVGAQSYSGGDLGADVGVRVVNASTLRIELVRPVVPGIFLKLLSLPVAAVIDTIAAQAGGTDWWSLPQYSAGSGPFMMAEWTPGVRAVYSRLPTRKNDTSLSTLTWVVIPDPAQALNAYRAGDVQIYAPQVSQYSAIKADAMLATQLVEVPGNCTMWLAFKNGTAPFEGASGIALRQAVGSAISSTLYISDVMGGNGFPAAGLVPTSLPGSNPAIAGLVYSPTLAQQRLAQSGYTGSPPLIVQNVNANTAHYVADKLAANLGIGVGYTSTLSPAVNIRIRGWCADFPDADNFIYNMLYSGVDGPWTGYQNPVVDGLIEQSHATVTDTLRFQLLQQAEQIGVDEAAVVPLYHSKYLLLGKPWLTGPVTFLNQWSYRLDTIGSILDKPVFVPRVTK